MMRFLLAPLFFLSFATAPFNARATKSTESIVLPVDQKLLDVAFLCPGGNTCTPWFLTRLIRNNEKTKSYFFTDNDRTVVVAETRQSLNWPWDRLETVELEPGQRLIGVAFRCTKDGCRPWYLTRQLREKESARTYTFTDSHTVILIHEDDSP